MYTKSIRQEYGDGPEADRLIYLCEGSGVYNRLIGHEARAKSRQELMCEELEDIRKKIFEAGDGSPEDWKIIMKAVKKVSGSE